MKVRTFKRKRNERRVFLGSLGAGLLGSCLPVKQSGRQICSVGPIAATVAPGSVYDGNSDVPANLGYVEAQTVELKTVGRRDEWSAFPLLPPISSGLGVTSSSPSARPPRCRQRGDGYHPIVIAYIGDPVGAGLSHLSGDRAATSRGFPS